MNIPTNVQDRAEKVQEECFEFIEHIKNNDNSIEYVDAAFVFFYTKIAELQLEIEELKKK